MVVHYKIANLRGIMGRNEKIKDLLNAIRRAIAMI